MTSAGAPVCASIRPGPGGITLVQRFGSALNLNIHFHVLVAEGTWQQIPTGHAFRRAFSA